MRWTILIPVILIGIHARSQELAYRQYTVKDGLPGSTVYQAVEDRQGYIWFATNQGVSRFDGRVFTNYYKEDGLPDNDIVRLYLDSYDNIWFISFTGTPAVMHDGVITSFPGCRHVLSVCEEPLTRSIVLMMAFNKEKSAFWGVYTSPGSNRTWQFTEHIIHSAFRPPDFPILRASAPDKTSFYFSVADSKHYMLTIRDGTTAKKLPFAREESGSWLPFDIYNFLSPVKERKGLVFYDAQCNVHYADTQGTRIILRSKDKSSDGLSRVFNGIFCENDSTLWICSRNRGLLCVKDFLRPHPVVQSFFSKSFCTAVIKDREGGYWITTYDDGVYYLPNLSFHYLSGYPAIMEKNALCIRAIGGGRLAAGFTDGNILQINSADAVSKYFPDWAMYNRNNRVMDIWPLGKDNLLAATDRGVRRLSSPGSPLMGPLAIKELYVLPDQSFLAGTHSGVYLMENTGYTRKNLFFERATCVTRMNRQYIWGTLHGVYAYDNNVVTDLGLRYPDLSGAINHLDVAPDSSLWASTQQGIVILKNDHITLLRKEQGIPGNMCKHVSFDNNTAWVSTDKGIARIAYRWSNGRLAYSVSSITEEDGLTTNNINRTLPAGNYVWAATARGISFFSKDYISHSLLAPRININKIMVGDEPVPVTDTLRIDYRKRKLLIGLSGISYRSGRQIYYEYRLPGLDSRWNRISNNSIEFPSLPFGKLWFEVRAVDRWGQRSEQPKKILIINTPPFWETTAFRAALYIATLLLLFFLFYAWHSRRQRRKEKEYRLEKKMHHLEMMALRAQMNPHFIFNCLTSIQYHIIRADVRMANHYLHKFSILIRQILQHSTQSFIPLREEVKMLELYLGLEKLRLGDRMEYRLCVSPGLRDADVAIPVMIVQPFVENAIKHGIDPLEGRKGLLIIDIRQTGQYIECSIEDNGPGIHASLSGNKIASPGHESMGAGITASRISTINAMQKQKILLQVTDKREAGHAGTGTLVHLSFPILTS